MSRKHKKFCRIFVVRPSFLQASSCYKVDTSVGLSAITLLRASFGALLRLYSAWCICSASFCMCLLYAPLLMSPPRQAQSPCRNNGLVLLAIGEDTSKGGWVGALKSELRKD